MEKSIWFKRKTYGWGWTPVNAIGWAIILAYTLIVLAYPLMTEFLSLPFDMYLFCGITFLSTAALIGICYWKGESPSWNWGPEDKTL